MKIAAFASGNGSNLTALVENGIEIDLVICNKPDAYVITRANNHNLDCVVIPTKGRDQGGRRRRERRRKWREEKREEYKKQKERRQDDNTQ